MLVGSSVVDGAGDQKDRLEDGNRQEQPQQQGELVRSESLGFLAPKEPPCPRVLSTVEARCPSPQLPSTVGSVQRKFFSSVPFFFFNEERKKKQTRRELRAGLNCGTWG